MAKRNRTLHARRIIGDILLVLAVLLIVDAAFVMPARINAVVLKSDYQGIFMYEIMLCVILLLLAMDIRFNLFTGWKPAILGAVGWLLRTVIVLLSAVTVFFCGRVITGGMVNTAGRAEAAVMRDILTEHGVPEDRLILEYQAQTTKESFRNIAGIVSVEE